MQADEPMIHTMYERMSSLLYNLMKKFINKNSITEIRDGKTRAKQGTNLTSVDLANNQMNLESIDIGTKAKTILMSSSISSAQREAFRKKCLSFFFKYYQISDIKTSALLQIPQRC